MSSRGSLLATGVVGCCLLVAWESADRIQPARERLLGDRLSPTKVRCASGFQEVFGSEGIELISFASTSDCFTASSPSTRWTA